MVPASGTPPPPRELHQLADLQPARDPTARVGSGVSMTIHPDTFIATWCRLQDARAVADELGMSHDAARGRAARLRRKGVDLPRLRRGPHKPAAGQGVAMRARRYKSGLSQAELAEKLGVSQSTVSRIERGLLQMDAVGGWGRVVEVCVGG